MLENLNSGPYLQKCICGRAFTRVCDYTRHTKGCVKGKKRLSGALSKAKELYRSKRACTEEILGTGSTNGQDLVPPGSAHSAQTSLEDQTQAHKLQLEVGSKAAINNCDNGSQPTDLKDDALSLAQRRPRRLNRRLPLRFRDMLPEPPMSLPPAEIQVYQLENPLPQATSESSQPCPMPTPAIPCQTFKTQPNSFGLFRVFKTDTFPSYDPDELPTTTPQSLFSHPTTDAHPGQPGTRINTESTDNPFHPYPNETSLRLGDWYWNQGPRKSQENFRKLLNIIGDLEFRPEDVRNTNWKGIDRELGSIHVEEESAGGDHDDGWNCSPVTISVPFHSRSQSPGPKDYTLPDFHHRKLVSIIREKLADPTHHHIFHYEPYELRWGPAHKTNDIGVHGELYTSEAFLDAHQQLQDLPHEPGCDLPRCIVALMFWSDSTHLTAFGSAKLWPLYLYFGNESKYMRSQPASNLCSHVAYFLNLPDAFKDFVIDHCGGKAPSDDLLTHCRRELFHAQWRLLLDDEFLEAYEHGIVVTCCDQVKRRIYPRIFTYSADYPEKVLIATMRNLGTCPCPRCLIPKARVHLLATETDILQRKLLSRSDTPQRLEKVAAARKLVYQRNYAVGAAQVEELLRDESWVPTVNAFSEKLSHMGFDLFLMLVVDLLHEFELGVWKAIFIQLLRILETLKKSSTSELDRRYHQVPTFSRDMIRHFRENSSELKKMAARDFEDLLQCSIPVFENLLPEPHNTQVQQLLFLLCHWHGLAKLRMHTDDTLGIMERVTAELAQSIRTFTAETCPAFPTKELRREADARRRRAAHEVPGKNTSSGSADARRPKTLNLQTYKMHALGDYHAQIRVFGTTDSFSTQPGELEHRVGKSRFTRTSRKAFIPQLASIERRQERIRRIKAKLRASHAHQHDPAPNAPDVHHVIGQAQNFPEILPLFQQQNSSDPALKDFIQKLKAHLLPRIRTIHSEESDLAHRPLSPNFQSDTATDINQLILKGNRFYRHNLFRINYTTYDVRRAQDTVNPRTEHCDVMLLSREPTDHPFCYARVLGVYHANVIYIGPGLKDYQPRRMEFLWVRWFEVMNCHSSLDHTALDAVRFPPMAEADAFGFVDPADILRCCHIIPAFAYGRLHPDGVAMSYHARDAADWKRYYVNRFVDRDALMRYHWGLGVGHTYAYGMPLLPSQSERDVGDHTNGQTTHNCSEPSDSAPPPL